MKKEYKARSGAPFGQDDAQKIGEELESIKEKEGNLTPINVIKTAKKKSSFLNQYFDWNDSDAAEKWRVQQARNIINHIVEVIIIEGEEEEVRSFWSVTTESGENQYATKEEVITTKSYRMQLIDEMETILKNLLKTLRLFKEQ